jgi:hypothetical protein
MTSFDCGRHARISREDKMKRVLLPVVLAITMVVFIGSLTGPSVWGQNDAFLIYGNRNGSVMTVFGGEIIEIPA